MKPSDMASQLKVYSIGIVAENKKLDSRIVEVTPSEDLPMLDGEINSEQVTDTVTSTDKNGGETQIKTNTANSISAMWLPLGSSNRHTAPDVRRGESVVLYRFADSDKFFWTTLHDDIKLRKLETVIWAFSGTKKESADIDADHYYFLEISTHKGLVHFHTSKANGEFCTYDIQINTKDGIINIVDDVGNVLVFDSKEHQIAMKNADDCSFEINKKNVTIIVPETYTLKAKNKIEEVEQTIKISSGDSISETTKEYTVDASDSLTETTSEYSLDASSSMDEKTGSYNLNADSSITEKAGGVVNINGSAVKISHNVALS